MSVIFSFYVIQSMVKRVKNITVCYVNVTVSKVMCCNTTILVPLCWTVFCRVLYILNEKKRK